MLPQAPLLHPGHATRSCLTFECELPVPTFPFLVFKFGVSACKPACANSLCLLLRLTFGSTFAASQPPAVCPFSPAAHWFMPASLTSPRCLPPQVEVCLPYNSLAVCLLPPMGKAVGVSALRELNRRLPLQCCCSR